MASIPKEYGIGTKYLVTPNVEFELLYTYYLLIYALVGFQRPSTFNFGF